MAAGPTKTPKPDPKPAQPAKTSASAPAAVSGEPEAGASASQRERKKYKPKAKTRWYFKLLGLLLVVLAGWIAYRTFYLGKQLDFSSEKGQQELLGDLKEDASVVAEKAELLGTWAMEDLGKMIKGKPPETDEEAAQLVKESKEEMAAHQKAAQVAKEAVAAKTETAAPSAPSAPAAPAKPAGAYGQAQGEYSEGAKYYAMTNPLKDSSTDIQKNIRLAAPHFSKCLDLCEKARGEGAGGPGLDALEQKAAKRLYDCNKRMELR